MIGIQVIEFLVIFMEALTGIWFNTEILSVQTVERKKIIWSSLIVSTIVWIMNQYQLFSTFTSVISIVAMIISALIICKIHVLDLFISTTFYMVLIYIMDFFSIAIVGVILQEKELAEMLAAGNSMIRIYTMLTSKFLLIGSTYFIAKKIFGRRDFPIRKMWVGLVLCCFFLIYMVKSTFFEVDMNILLAWAFFLVVVILAIYSVVQYMNYIQEKNRLSLTIERNNIQLDAYNQLIQNYQEKQIFYHDLKNQYLVMENYLKDKEYAKLEEYMEALNVDKLKSVYEKRTGIQAVDILLDYKIKEAEALNIEVEVVADTINLNIPEQEMISLLGNAMDNAIEACKKMENGVKWIRITIRRIQEMALLKISNSYEQQPVEKSGQFVSSKNNPHVHGLGMKSMRAIVEKNDGKMKIEYSNGEFSLVISFFH